MLALRGQQNICNDLRHVLSNIWVFQDRWNICIQRLIHFFLSFFLSTTSLPLPLQKEDLHLFFGFSPLSGIFSTKTISVSEGFVKYCLIIFWTCDYTFCREVLFLMFGSSVIPCLARLDMNGRLILVNTDILQHVSVTEDWSRNIKFVRRRPFFDIHSSGSLLPE